MEQVPWALMIRGLRTIMEGMEREAVAMELISRLMRVGMGTDSDERQCEKNGKVSLCEYLDFIWSIMKNWT